MTIRSWLPFFHIKSIIYGMSEVHGRPTGFEGSGFEFLRDEVASLEVKSSEVKSELASIEQQRLDAIATAEAPFTEPIRAAKDKIAELEVSMCAEKIAERIQQADLDELSFTALDIILRKHNMSLLEFSEGIKELTLKDKIRHHYRSSQTKKQLAEFAGFLNLRRSLAESNKSNENGSLPVGMFTLEWVEETDGQAGWDDRDPRTGIFVKKVDAIIGNANMHDISVVNRNTTPELLVPVLQPQSIVLGISKAIIVKAYSYWGEEKSELTEIPGHDIELISAPPKEDRRLLTPPDTDWEKSLKGSFPFVDSQSHTTLQAINRVRYIIWGEKLKGVVSDLSDDRLVPPSTRTNLKTIKEQL